MARKKKTKKVMVFGVFDRLHPGHISFLEQAAAYGDELIVVVARDASVRELKNKTPHHSEAERIQEVRKIVGVNRVVLGDETLGSYAVLGDHKPDIICLGYDQGELAEDVQKRIKEGKLAPISVVVLTAHKPQVFHTSLLTDRE